MESVLATATVCRPREIATQSKRCFAAEATNALTTTCNAKSLLIVRLLAITHMLPILFCAGSALCFVSLT
jgi:hypothetical protein